MNCRRLSVWLFAVLLTSGVVAANPGDQGAAPPPPQSTPQTAPVFRGGVNYVLGVGLHSYGFGGGRSAWVFLGTLVNVSLVAHACWRRDRGMAAAG